MPRKNPTGKARGSQHGRSKLTEEQVLAIRRRWFRRNDSRPQLTQTQLGHEYGVTQGAIKLIVRGVNWKHVGGPIARVGDWKRGSTDPLRRFWAKVLKTDRCWLWTAGVSGPGYGSFGRETTHRYSWQLHYGPIPDGLGVLHRCDEKLCVRPDHLFLGTFAENMADKLSKGRQAKGERVAGHKLTSDQVIEMRRAHADGVRQADLARRYGIRSSSVSQIVHGKRWKHVR